MKNWLLIYGIVSFGPSLAQPSLSELLAENQQIELVPSQLDAMGTLALFNEFELEQLRAFFQNGGVISNYYQLQGILHHSTTAQINQKIPLLLLPPSTFVSGQSHYKVSNYKSEFRINYPSFLKQNNQWRPHLDTNYLGPAMALRYRWQCNYLNWQLNGQLAKDSGEPIWYQGKNGGVDYQTFTAFLNNDRSSKTIKRFVMGAYQIQWGQGLQLWTSRGMGKSIDLLQLVRKPLGLKPYSGNDEQRYFQGAAICLGKSKNELLVFSSIRHVDAIQKLDTLSNEFNFSYSSGYHRTLSEIAKRKQQQELIFGIAFNQNKELFRWGLCILQHSQIYSSVGANWQWSKKQYYFYGEEVLSRITNGVQPPQWAHNFGLIYFFDPKLEMAAHLRYYAPYYLANYANPISNISSGSNELGLIVQLKSQLTPNWALLLALERAAVYLKPNSAHFYDVINDSRLVLNYLSKHKTQARLQFSQRYPKSNQAILGLQFNCQIELDQNWQLNVVGQLLKNTKVIGSSRQLRCSIRYIPKSKGLRLELSSGMYQANSPLPPLYMHAYLLGVGTQTMLLSGVGSFTMGSIRWQVSGHWQIQFHSVFTSNLKGVGGAKVQCGGMFRYEL
jgi:hypothetical protein